MPVFLLALLGILLFYRRLGWLPATGRTALHATSRARPASSRSTALLRRSAGRLRRRALAPDPAGVLRGDRPGGGHRPGAALEPGRRAAAPTTCAPPGPRAWRERAVLFRYALRNSIGPALSMTGLQVGLMFAGVVVVESIFAWPGIGFYTVQSIPRTDFPAIAGVTLVLGAGYVRGQHARRHRPGLGRPPPQARLTLDPASRSARPSGPGRESTIVAGPEDAAAAGVGGPSVEVEHGAAPHRACARPGRAGCGRSRASGGGGCAARSGSTVQVASGSTRARSASKPGSMRPLPGSRRIVGGRGGEPGQIAEREPAVVEQHAEPGLDPGDAEPGVGSPAWRPCGQGEWSDAMQSTAPASTRSQSRSRLRGVADRRRAPAPRVRSRRRRRRSSPR